MCGRKVGKTNLCWVIGKVPQDWKEACVVPFCKGVINLSMGAIGENVCLAMERVGRGVRIRKQQGVRDANVLLYADDDVLLAKKQGFESTSGSF